jgi:hypothetical protein
VKARDGVVQESEIDRPDPDAPAAVPAGATSARLCQGPGTTFRVPSDALVTDVDGVVSAINGLEETGEPDICTSDLGPGFRIAFGYDDGSTFVVSGKLYGCHTLVVGSGYRAGPEAAQDALVTRLQSQREESEPPSALPDVELTCGGEEPAVAAKVEDVTTALLCTSVGRGPTWSTQIPPEDLDVLLADIEANSYEGGGVDSCYREAPWISGVTAWGDAVVIGHRCNDYLLPDGRGWDPSPASQQIIDRLVSEAR